MTSELHIASLVVHANPGPLAEVTQKIEAMPGARVHAASANGKIVVTLEADSGDAVLSAVNFIQRIDGVLSAALVYQYADSREAMMEEITEEMRNDH